MIMKEKIIEILTSIHPEFDFTDESLNFIEEGMLDSFDVVKLLDRLENAFGIVIDGDDIIPENFVSLDSIMEMVKKSGAN